MQGSSSNVEELSEQSAEDLWSRSSHFLEGERSRSWHEFQVRQPTLHQYIVERSESRFEPEIAELLEQTASLIWRIFLSEDEELERIRSVDIEDLERSNASVLQLLSDDSSLEADFEDRFDMLMQHSSDLPQRHLFRLTFEHLDSAHQDRNPELDDFNFALLMFYLRVFIDCLDQA